MTSLDEDLRLVGLVRSGQLDAFNELVDRHQGAAYNLALRMLGRAEPAADVTQDSLLSAYRHLDSYRGGSFRAWLLRIVTNACYDELRKRQRQPADSLNELLEDTAGLTEPVDPDPSPVVIAEQHDVQRRLAGLLLRLPAEFRVVLVLADIQGYGYDEIAAIVDVELGTVKSRLSRARARLRDLIRADRELYDDTKRLISRSESRREEAR